MLAHTTPDYTDLAPDLAFDAAKAKSLLGLGRLEAGQRRHRAEDGKKLSLTIDWIPNAATNQPALELIQQQLKAVGFR